MLGRASVLSVVSKQHGTGATLLPRSWAAPGLQRHLGPSGRAGAEEVGVIRPLPNPSQISSRHLSYLSGIRFLLEKLQNISEHH